MGNVSVNTFLLCSDSLQLLTGELVSNLKLANVNVVPTRNKLNSGIILSPKLSIWLFSIIFKKQLLQNTFTTICLLVLGNV